MTAVTLLGGPELKVWLERVEQTLTPVGYGLWLESMALPYVRDQSAMNFARQGTKGGAWKALSGYTILERQDRGTWPGPILVDEGFLKDWLDDDDGRVVVAGAVAELLWPASTPSSVEGAKFDTAQAGAPNPNPDWEDIPARPVAVILQDDVAALLASFEQFLEIMLS